MASFAEVVCPLDSGNRYGRGLVGRSPWTARDALVPLPERRPWPARRAGSRGVGLQACHAGIRTGILPNKPVGRAILPADALSSASKPAEKPARSHDCLPHEWQSCFMTSP